MLLRLNSEHLYLVLLIHVKSNGSLYIGKEYKIKPKTNHNPFLKNKANEGGH